MQGLSEIDTLRVKNRNKTTFVRGSYCTVRSSTILHLNRAYLYLGKPKTTLEEFRQCPKQTMYLQTRVVDIAKIKWLLQETVIASE